MVEETKPASGYSRQRGQRQQGARDATVGDRAKASDREDRGKRDRDPLAAVGIVGLVVRVERLSAIEQPGDGHGRGERLLETSLAHVLLQQQPLAADPPWQQGPQPRYGREPC